MNKIIFISVLATFITALSGQVHSEYMPDQDEIIVGKKLWLYHDIPECRTRLKLYSGTSKSNPVDLNNATEIEILDLLNRPLNWTSDRWYKVRLIAQDENAYFIYSDMNSDLGSLKNLYYAESNFEPVLLQNACISNISRVEKENILFADQKQKSDLQAKNFAELDEQNRLKRIEREEAAALEEDRIAALQIAKKEEAERVMALRLKEEAAAYQTFKENQLRGAPSILKKMTKFEFCAAYGQYLRNEEVSAVGKGSEIAPAMMQEAKRRKIQFNSTLAKEGKIKIGMSQCSMYASWGFPSQESRSVGSWGVHIQHIYGSFGPYVYTENGLITSWQD